MTSESINPTTTAVYGSIAPPPSEDVHFREDYEGHDVKRWPSFMSTDCSTGETSLVDLTTRHGFEGTATIPSEIASIAKNLVGSGVLALSGGLALFANDPSAVIPASIIIVLLGTIFGYFCLLIAKVCQKTRSASYRECWENTMGNRGGVAVALVNALLPAQGNLSYATVLSQTFKSLLETIHIHWSRVTCLLFITVFILLPFCMMKNLDALAPFSALGVASVGVVMVSMLIRCFDGTYQPGGYYYEHIETEYQPLFGQENYVLTARVLPFVCMVFHSWVMHYNTPRFYTELKDATIPRFTKVVGWSFGLAACICILIAAAGFWTFGENSGSYILNNYSPNDPLATASRLGVFMSTLLIYPLAFIGVRDGCFDLFQVPSHKQTGNVMNIFSIVLLSLLTVLAILVHDLGVINAVGGGTLATLLCFVFPALMYREAVMRSPDRTREEEREVCISMSLMVFGSLLGIIGVWQSIDVAAQGGEYS